MYIQLTTRCNMECAHCCFSATKAGEDMTEDLFSETLLLATSLGEMITLGGGEPTIHRHFKKFLHQAMDLVRDKGLEQVLVITNGKKTSAANWLLERVTDHEFPLHVELSLDPYHDPIDPILKKRWKDAAFMSIRRNKWHMGRGLVQSSVGIRDSGYRVQPWGRALALGLASKDDENVIGSCCCEDLLVDPSGDIYTCGCKTRKISHVRSPTVLKDLEFYDRETAHVEV